MGTSLTGTTPATTYDALIKVGDNEPIGASLKTLSDGLGNDSALQLSTRRIGVLTDSSVTTQTSSVIASTTTNANLVIAPNGTGALVADIPDGTATGGNARGNYATDLQKGRNLANEVASGQASVINGGEENKSSNFWTTVGGGYKNYAIETAATISGGYSNNANTRYSTISGGQSNAASTGTHATVVGGQSNTSSNNQSISGGLSTVASGANSLALGYKATASATGAISIASNDGNGTPQASGNWSNVFGGVNSTATNTYATALGGYRSVASGYASYALGYRITSYLRGQLSIGEFFTNDADAQQSLLTARKSDTLTTGATTTLSLDGTGTTNLIIPNGTNRMWNVQVRWVAVVTAITGTATGVTVGDTKTSTDLLAVAKRGGITTVSAHTSAGTHAIETIAGSLTAANITYTAGASQEMAITFTGPTFAGGGSVNMRVVAAISLTEVAY